MGNCDYAVTWSKRIEYIKENKLKIPKEEGVYEIQGHISSSDKFTRRYVGRSDDLQRRYGEHLNDGEDNEKLKDFLEDKKAYFRYAPTKDEETSKDIEKGLYDEHKHTFNDPDNPPAGSGNCSSIKVTETNP